MAGLGNRMNGQSYGGLTMNRFFAMATVAAVAALLGACGGGGGGGTEDPVTGGNFAGEANEFCRTITDPWISRGCKNCVGVNDVTAPFDHSLSHGASMTSGAQSTFSGRTTEQPAGDVAGIYFGVPEVGGSLSVSIATYLGDTLQDASGPSTVGSGNNNCAVFMDCLGNGPEGFIGLHTTKPYDRVEATVSNGSVGEATAYEVCVR